MTLKYDDVSTAKEDVKKDIMLYAMSVSPVSPSTEDGEEMGAQPSGQISQPSCYATTEEDRERNTCMAGMELIPGQTSTCVENPENPCREGSKCMCDMGLDTLEGKLKFGLALLVVQSIGFASQVTAGIPVNTALGLQLNAGPMDTIGAFTLLAVVEGKKTCKCVNSGFPSFETHVDLKAQGGCLGDPQKMEKMPGSINQLNSYWFLPEPGHKIVMGRGGIITGAVAGAGAVMMGAGTVGVEVAAMGDGLKIAMAAGGIAGAFTSFLMASCQVVECEDNDTRTAWIEGEGFANCKKTFNSF